MSTAPFQNESIAASASARGGWKRFLLARLSEGSTYRGAMLILTAMGVALRPEVAAAITAFGMAAAGLLGIVLPDSAPVPPEE